jgi:hypothetical protein
MHIKRRIRWSFRGVLTAVIALVTIAALALAIYAVERHQPIRGGATATTPARTGGTERSELDAIANLLSAVLWPLFATGVIVFLATSRGRALVSQAFGRVTRMSALGLELEFNPERARQIERTLESKFDEYLAEELDEFDRIVRERGISRLRDRLATECIEPLLIEAARQEFRCTLYVQDLIFDEGLYQLLDYFPTGGGRGRVITKRFGLVGRAFRAEESQTDDEVPATTEGLVVQWGMTIDEALRAGKNRHSFSCVILKDSGGVPIGGVYVDAVPQKAFGENESARSDFELAIADFAESKGLTAALAEVARDLRWRGPRIQLFKEPRK